MVFWVQQWFANPQAANDDVMVLSASGFLCTGGICQKLQKCTLWAKTRYKEPMQSFCPLSVVGVTGNLAAVSRGTVVCTPTLAEAGRESRFGTVLCAGEGHRTGGPQAGGTRRKNVYDLCGNTSDAFDNRPDMYDNL